jgi:hypothetical protein
MTMLFVSDECPICRTGIIGIRRCADGETLVLLCDECERVWESPRLISKSNALDPEPPEFVVRKLGVSIAGGSAAWATKEEVTAAGWADYVKGTQPAA